jgi:hypothetical protein
MQQHIPSNPSVSIDQFKAEDWAKVPVQTICGECSKSVDLRINTGAGEYLIVGLQSDEDLLVPVMDIPAIVEMTPTDVRALAFALERVAAVMDEIASRKAA